MVEIFVVLVVLLLIGVVVCAAGWAEAVCDIRHWRHRAESAEAKLGVIKKTLKNGGK